MVRSSGRAEAAQQSVPPPNAPFYAQARIRAETPTPANALTTCGAAVAGCNCASKGMTEVEARSLLAGIMKGAVNAFTETVLNAATLSRSAFALCIVQRLGALAPKDCGGEGYACL